MSLTATYDGLLARVRLAATSLLPGAPFTIERSTVPGRWVPVRGAVDVLPTSGSIQVDDYEFVSDVVNSYRVRGTAAYDTFARTVSSGWGTATSGQAWTVDAVTAAEYSTTGTVGVISVGTTNAERRIVLPIGSAGVQEVRATWLVPVVPTGAPINVGLLLRWQNSNNYYWVDVQIATNSSLSLRLIKRVAGTLTQVASVSVPVTHSTSVPRVLVARVEGSMIKARVYPSGEEPEASWQLTVTDPDLTVGTSIGVVTRLMTGNTNGTVQVRVRDLVVSEPAGTLYTTSITPAIGGVWLKSIARPFLNRQVVVKDFSDVERPARVGVHEVIGRSYPVAVSDVRGSRRWTMEILAGSLDEAADLDLVLAAGDPLLVQVPAGCDVPGGYVTVGDITTSRPARRSPRRVITLPLTEVAAPSPDVVGATVNWQAVMTAYGSWSAVLAAHPTWQSLAEIIGDPQDVVVP